MKLPGLIFSLGVACPGAVPPPAPVWAARPPALGDSSVLFAPIAGALVAPFSSRSPRFHIPRPQPRLLAFAPSLWHGAHPPLAWSLYV